MLGKYYRSLHKQRETKLVWFCPYFLLGADPEANWFENYTLFLGEPTGLLQKKTKEGDDLYAQHIQRAESSTSRLENLVT